mgnify:CR=1 FL=1
MKVSWKLGVSITYDEANVVLDPHGNEVNVAFITHAHSDHAEAFRLSHLPKFSSEETRDLISTYGYNIGNWRPLKEDVGVKVGHVEVVPHNSGHVLGSYEFEVVTPDCTLLYTGDFNTRNTLTMKPAEVVPCDILVLDSTFGSPSFVFPPQSDVADEMIKWAKETIRHGKIPTFQTDPLGNAQEIIRIFNEFSDFPVLTHWRVSKMSEVYNHHGYRLDFTDSRTKEGEELFTGGEAVFITPKGLDLSAHPEIETALVSGWALWAKRKAFALSDHADFPNLLKFVEECNPKLVLTCHGGRFNTVLADKISKELKIQAYRIDLITTIFEKRKNEARLMACEREILKFAKVPGFSYSKRTILNHLKTLGFSRSEINLALRRLEEKGFLEARSQNR